MSTLCLRTGLRRTALAIGCAALFATAYAMPDATYASSPAPSHRPNQARDHGFMRSQRAPARVSAAKTAQRPPVPFGGTVLPVTVCGDDGSPGTLRDVVASVVDDGTTIDLTQLPTDCSVITLELGAIAPTKSIAIVGPGAGMLTIDGQDQSRVFTTKYDLTIQDIAIANGYSAVGGGGCVSVQKSVAITRALVTNCHAGDRDTTDGIDNPKAVGGAINVVGDLTLVEASSRATWPTAPRARTAVASTSRAMQRSTGP